MHSTLDGDRLELTDQVELTKLLRENQELRAACRVWIASNEVKDERIQLLERRVTRLSRRLVRLSRLLRLKRRPSATESACRVEQ